MSFSSSVLLRYWTGTKEANASSPSNPEQAQGTVCIAEQHGPYPASSFRGIEENNAIQCRVRLHQALFEGPARSLLSMASYAFFVRSTLRLEVSRDGFTFSPGRGTSSAFLPAVSMIRSALEFRTGTVRRRTAQSTLHGTPYLGGGNEATLETTPHANIIILYNTTFTPHEYNNYTPIPQHCTGVSNSPNAPVFKSISPWNYTSYCSRNTRVSFCTFCFQITKA
jgi:hypothetical protein